MTTTEADATSSDDPAGAAAGKADAPKVKHFTLAERAAKGKAAREATPRSSHGVWEPAPDRPDPVGLLEEQAATRVVELVPIRYGRMLVSPFAFFRGAAYLMASDLSGAPRTGLRVQLCGDAHLSNFGVFAAPDRRLTFSVNDFDETLPGPFEWDVKRLAASFAVAGRARGFDLKQRESVNLTVGRSYREAMRNFAQQPTLDIWYSRLDLDEILDRWSSSVSKERLKEVERKAAKARTRDSLTALDKLTRDVNGERKIVSNPPLLVPVEELLAPDESHQFHETIRTCIRSYRRTLPRDRRLLLERFHYVDAARKVVGVGSVGTRAWIILMVGNDNSDPLFLQLKEAQASVLEPFLGTSKFAQHGQRVVEGQRLMQSASDIMLGWLRVKSIDHVERDFYIRQLWDGKASADVETMELRTMKVYAEMCGWTLARAHARSGDSVAIAHYLGEGDVFDQALASFAERYADQNEQDHAALRQAVDSGRVTAQAGL